MIFVMRSWNIYQYADEEKKCREEETDLGFFRELHHVEFLAELSG
jgi:hypothetical protein